MLSRRSKVAITIAVVAGLFLVAARVDRVTSWAKEDVLDSYSLGIAFGVLAAFATLSIVVDVKKSR
jgi:hypothetical protein